MPEDALLRSGILAFILKANPMLNLFSEESLRSLIRVLAVVVVLFFLVNLYN